MDLASIKDQILNSLYQVYRNGMEPTDELGDLTRRLGLPPIGAGMATQQLAAEDVITFAALPHDPRETPTMGYLKLTSAGIQAVERSAVVTTGLPAKSANNSTKEVFVIMAFRPEMDQLFDEIYAPSIVRVGLSPFRVDRNHEGRSLTVEILEGLERCSMAIADLSFERPNCYAEVGYLLGLKKNPQLLMTAEASHNPRRDGRQPSDPKVHFDLDSYYIEYYHLDDLDDFSKILHQRLTQMIERKYESPHSASTEFQLGEKDKEYLKDLQRRFRERS